MGNEAWDMGLCESILCLPFTRTSARQGQRDEGGVGAAIRRRGVNEPFDFDWIRRGFHRLSRDYQSLPDNAAVEISIGIAALWCGCHCSSQRSLAAAALAEDCALLLRPCSVLGILYNTVLYYVYCSGLVLCFLYTLSLLFAFLLCFVFLGILRAAVKILFVS